VSFLEKNKQFLLESFESMVLMLLKMAARSAAIPKYIPKKIILAF